MAKAQWWLCVPVAVLCLLFLDALLGLLWVPHSERLPEQFSAAYLQRVVAEHVKLRPVVFLGDSVLWGYRLPPQDAAATILERKFSAADFLNLSYEGGSSVNSYFMLRYLLKSGVRPALLIFNVNSKETNSEDSAYRRLHPSLEQDVPSMFESADRRRLNLLPAPTLASRLESAVGAVWTLYRYRVDLREDLFGVEDAATALARGIQRATGSERLQAIEHRPTPEKFLTTYDLNALEPDNIDYYYLRRLALLVKRARIPAIAVLTPTNHRLLHDYIDSPDYDAKLRQLAAPLKRAGILTLNFDRSISAEDFLDNDHMTINGNRRFAALLEPYITDAYRR